ncbi:MAG: hypothetical protein IH843_05085 [Thaumarchaeota archaeon]|nr:hypothetical protein [Nitrososphaerota archaeon]
MKKYIVSILLTILGITISAGLVWIWRWAELMNNTFGSALTYWAVFMFFLFFVLTFVPLFVILSKYLETQK